MNALRTLISIAVIASLAACGGGGSSTPADTGNGNTGSTGNGSTGTVTLAVPVTGTIQAAAPAAAPAAPGLPTVIADAFSTLNQLRTAAGAGPLYASSQLDVAAAAHVSYLMSNGFALLHNEAPGAVNFYGATPKDRIAKSGFVASVTDETFGGTGVSGKGADYALGLMNTVYHSVAQLGRSTHAGFGASLDSIGEPLLLTDFATQTTASSVATFGQVPAVGALVSYPTANQTGLPETFVPANESPRPPVSVLPSSTAGTPVIVSVGNAEYFNNNAAGTLLVTVTTFNLKDASGNLVPVAILASPEVHGAAGVAINADTQSVITSGFAVMVPLSPLVKGQTYTASFSATLKSGGAALAKTWSFKTAP